jgi:hypothetical protein
MSILTDEIEDLIEEVEDADSEVATSQGPLTEPALTAVRINLNNAQTNIANILLLISNAGAADTNNLPGDLPSIADECVTLANAALTEALRTTPNNATIGNHVKTIDRIIDVKLGYRDRAGI